MVRALSTYEELKEALHAAIDGEDNPHVVERDVNTVFATQLAARVCGLAGSHPVRQLCAAFDRCAELGLMADDMVVTTMGRRLVFGLLWSTTPEDVRLELREIYGESIGREPMPNIFLLEQGRAN